jgi:hypothetical protein
MDRTLDFFALVPDTLNVSSNHSTNKSSQIILVFPNIKQSDELLQRIQDMERIVESSQETYIDYNRFLKPIDFSMDTSSQEENIHKFENEIGLFLATCTTETQQFRKLCESNLKLNESYLKHCMMIVNILMEVRTVYVFFKDN